MKNHKVAPLSADLIALLFLAVLAYAVWFGARMAVEMSDAVEPIKAEMGR